MPPGTQSGAVLAMAKRAVLGGMGPEDVAQMMQFAQGMMGGLMAQVPRDPGGTQRDPGPVVTQDGQAVA